MVCLSLASAGQLGLVAPGCRGMHQHRAVYSQPAVVGRSWIRPTPPTRRRRELPPRAAAASEAALDTSAVPAHGVEGTLSAAYRLVAGLSLVFGASLSLWSPSVMAALWVFSSLSLLTCTLQRLLGAGLLCAAAASAALALEPRLTTTESLRLNVGLGAIAAAVTLVLSTPAAREHMTVHPALLKLLIALAVVQAIAAIMGAIHAAVGPRHPASSGDADATGPRGLLLTAALGASALGLAAWAAASVYSADVVQAALWRLEAGYFAHLLSPADRVLYVLLAPCTVLGGMIAWVLAGASARGGLAAPPHRLLAGGLAVSGGVSAVALAGALYHSLAREPALALLGIHVVGLGAGVACFFVRRP